MALFSILIVAAVVVAISLVVARLGLALTLSVAGQAAQLKSKSVARETSH